LALTVTSAWTKNDFDTVAHLADDLSFEGPGGRTGGAQAYLDALRAFVIRASVTGANVIAAVGSDEEAMIMYDAVTTAEDPSPSAASGCGSG
jgi:hypothetical protein